jgi:two-component system, oxyanion-binding sensor
VKRDIDLGFIALTDAAPLIVARELEFFAQEGLAVSLHREVSWATVRDKVAAGLHQGAHMLAPMVLAANLGAGSEPAGLIAPLSLNAHGAALGVSKLLGATMAALDPEAPTSARALARAVAERRNSDEPSISIAVVFPYSMHNYMLRYWAASAGIDPDRDIRIITAAPTKIAARLKSGEIDGFCVGAPWGALCEAESGAKIVLTAGAFWPGGPDKVLGLSATWAEREPESVLALTRAILRAALWADAPENRAALAQMLAQEHYLDATVDLIAARLGPGDDINLRFARHATSFPWRSHALWILSQMLRWGQVADTVEFSSAAAAYRPDLFRAAAASLNVTAPIADSKIEGAHAGVWRLEGASGAIPMARDTFFDGAVFDPDSARRYAASFAISRVS